MRNYDFETKHETIWEELCALLDEPAPYTEPERQSTVWRQPDFMASIVLCGDLADYDE